MGEGSEKRNDFRASSQYPFWYRRCPDGNEEEEWQRTVTRDLSAGGAAFWLGSAEIHEQDIVEFQLLIPPRPVFGIGEVVRVFEDTGNGKAAAVRFASLESRDKDRIARVVLSDGLEDAHGKSRG